MIFAEVSSVPRNEFQDVFHIFYYFERSIFFTCLVDYWARFGLSCVAVVSVVVMVVMAMGSHG